MYSSVSCYSIYEYRLSTKHGAAAGRAGRRRSKTRLNKLVSSQRTAHAPFEEGRRHRSNEKRPDFTPCYSYSSPLNLHCL